MQRELQYFGKIEIAGQDIGFLAERATSTQPDEPPQRRVNYTFAHPHQFLDDQIGVENRWLPKPGADDPGGATHESGQGSFC